MKNTIEEITRLLLQGTLTKNEADKILLDLHNISDKEFNDYLDWAIAKTKMITDELKVLVKKEAQKLKKYATPEELAELDFCTVNANSIILCLYGQMTGDCYSQRANELIKKCTITYSDDLTFFDKPKGMTPNRAFSPIEFYIAQDGAKTKALIDFLKGKSETLNL